VQFFQVGNEEGAKEALEELDDGLSELVEGGVRDIVDTVTWTGGCSQSEGGVGLTGDGVLKAVSQISELSFAPCRCFEGYGSRDPFNVLFKLIRKFCRYSALWLKDLIVDGLAARLEEQLALSS
jgi:hypothetical protein